MLGWIESEDPFERHSIFAQILTELEEKIMSTFKQLFQSQIF